MSKFKMKFKERLRMTTKSCKLAGIEREVKVNTGGLGMISLFRKGGMEEDSVMVE